jgi:hypothetical protein
MQRDSFLVANAQAATILGCLSEPLTPFDTAVYHRVQALDAFLAKDAPRGAAAYAAVLAAQPSYELSSAIAPPGHRLRTAFDAAKLLPPSATVTVPPAAGGVVQVDGKRSGTRPTERPSILQFIATDGSITWTVFLAPGQTPPDWEIATTPVATSVPGTTTTEPPVVTLAPTRSLGRKLVPVVGSAAATSAALWGLSVGARYKFNSVETDYENVDAWQGRTNTLLAASYGVGGLALAVGATAVVTW